MKSRAILVLSVALCTCTVSAEEVLREISWLELRDQGELSVGEVIEANDSVPFERLKVDNSVGVPQTFAVLSISEPGITSSRYAITGKVRYEDVEGIGYLEMWSYFSDGGTYFSRTLDTSGPLQRLTGSCDWRSFRLPFFAEGTKARPIKLELNLVFQRGTVYLSPLEVVQYEKAGGPFLASRGAAWWDDRTAGIVGGIMGSIIGLTGGLIGLLATMGKARRVALFLLTVLSAIGVLSVLFGLAALVLSQPYSVYYPLLLLGCICTIVPIFVRGSVRRRFEEIEFRKMKAMDVSRG